jgi:hypothetical protein
VAEALVIRRLAAAAGPMRRSVIEELSDSIVRRGGPWP